MGSAVRTLYTGPLSMFGMKAEIALREKGLPFERVEVAYSAREGYSPKHPEVVRINPKCQVPVLVDGDLELFDSTQIFEYLHDIAPEPALWPREPRARALARQLEHLSDEVYFPHIIRLMGLQERLGEPQALTEIAAAQAFHDQFERQLADRSYLAGDYSFADIAFYMAQLFGERMGVPLTVASPKLRAWRDRVGERPAVRPVMARFAAYLRDNHRVVPPHLRG
jgi:glutathione S-transferase